MSALALQTNLRKTCRLSGPELEECKQQVTTLLAKGIFSLAAIHMAHPIVFVNKKTGDMRMCIYFRALTDQTVKNRYPLPCIQELFEKLQGGNVFSSIELQSAYNHVRLKLEDVPETAYIALIVLFEFQVYCFGLMCRKIQLASLCWSILTT